MSLTLFLPKVGQDIEPEHERECEHGKEERSPICHSIGMRKEGSNWVICLKNSIPRIAVNSSCSQSLVFIPHRQERKRLPPLSACLLHTSNSLMRLSTRGLHFLDATECNFTHWQARYRVHRPHTDECPLFCPAFPSSAAAQDCQNEADLLAAAVCWPTGIRICSHFGLHLSVSFVISRQLLTSGLDA